MKGSAALAMAVAFGFVSCFLLFVVVPDLEWLPLAAWLAWCGIVSLAMFIARNLEQQS